MLNFFNKYPYTDFHELNLDWVIKTVKELSAEWAATLTEWHNTQEEWQQLYDYVHDYFDNLDVQQEINNKLDQMALDGSLASLAQPFIDAKVAQLLPSEVSTQIGPVVSTQIGSVVASQIGGAVSSQLPAAVGPTVTNWLQDNVTPVGSAVVVDSSLTIQGAAADAKKTGNEINALKDALIENNTIFSLSSVHSSGADQVAIDIPNGTQFYCIVETTNNESTGGVLVGIDDQNQSSNIASVAANTLYTFTATAHYKKFGVYLTAPANPCVVTFRIIGEGSALIAYDRTEVNRKNIDSIVNGVLDTYATNWHQTGVHSSSADHVPVNIANNETYYVFIRTDTGESLTGALLGIMGSTTIEQRQVQTNVLYSFTASGNMDQFGLYLPAPVNPLNVYFSIIKKDSLLDLDQLVDGVPEYWISNLDTCINDIAQLQTYQQGVTFGFITDIHWETNHQVSPALIDYINRHSRVDMWLNGGDTASGDTGSGTQQIEWLYDAIGRYGHDYKFYSIIGNHDNNSVGGTPLSAATMKNLIMPYYNDVTFGPGNYYYYDYRNTRFVCLDTDSMGSGVNDPTQIAWTQNVIINSPYPVIIAMHIVFLTYADAVANTPCPFFNSLISAIGTNPNVKMIVSGHIHNDKGFIAINGTPVIILDTDSRFADDGITRAKGTTTEQCLSVITNDYTNKVINVTRIGTIQTSFSLSY